MKGLNTRTGVLDWCSLVRIPTTGQCPIWKPGHIQARTVRVMPGGAETAKI
jgi:hypothetical protein